jgi:hypothetical protein
MATPESLARIRAFDELQVSTCEVLSNEHVQRRLGNLASELAALNENAFLPDVRGGLVSIPYHRRDTDDVAVLPVGFDGRYVPLHADKSMFQMTPAMRQKVYDRFISQGLDDRDAEAFIERGCKEDDSLYCLSIHPEFQAYMVNAIRLNLPAKVRSSSRPFIIINTGLGMPRLELGRAHSHELSHVVDAQASADLPVNLVHDLAATELRAYNTEMRIFSGLCSAGYPADEIGDISDALKVETYRRMCNTKGAPFATPDILVELLRQNRYMDLAYVDSLATITNAA